MLALKKLIKLLQTIHFDFFNFAGIHREVELLWLPEGAIDGVQLDAAVSVTVVSSIIELAPVLVRLKSYYAMRLAKKSVGLAVLKAKLNWLRSSVGAQESPCSIRLKSA